MGTRWPLYQANAVVKGGVRTRIRVEKEEKGRVKTVDQVLIRKVKAHCLIFLLIKYFNNK